VSSRAGMTLIEIMVVILIIALATTGIAYGLGAVTQANLRSACMTINAAARGAYGRAISENSTVRLLFNFETHQMSFEEAHGRVVLTRIDDATREEIGEEEDVSVVDPWSAAHARLEDTLRPSFGASPFSALPGRAFRARELASGVRIVRLIVPHEPEPVIEDQGAIYFFPGGQTEHAIIWVGDNNDRVYSVEIHPLTGRGTVHDFGYEPEQLLDDGTGETRSELEP